MKYPPVQVLDAPRPRQVPANFISWQFAFYGTQDEEESRLLTRLLITYLRKRFGKRLTEITRDEAQLVADDINQHCETLESVLPYVRRKLLEQGEP